MGFSSDWLGGDETDTIRPGEAVAHRALALGAAVALSFDADRAKILAWLGESGVDRNLTDRERIFVSAATPNTKDIAHFTWCSEALTVLLWSIGKLAELPPANEPCDVDALIDALPPYGDQSTKEFLASAHTRSDDELWNMALELQNLHALARAQRRSPRHRPDEQTLDLEVIQERHRAINWVVGYCGQDWEEVTTDT